MLLLLLSSVRAGQAMMFANHSLESCSSQRIREFFGSFPAFFPAPQYGFYNVI